MALVMHDLSRGTIVVTGGAGLIGSALVWALNRRGLDDILVVDRLDESEKWRHLVPLRFADYIDADEFEARAMDGDDFGGVGTMLHLGACSATTERDADYLTRNNYEYTKTSGGWAHRTRTRFVYASSAATYGALEEDLPTKPTSRPAPAQHVRVLEAALRSLRARNGFADSVCGIKYFNVFGPNEDHKGDDAQPRRTKRSVKFAKRAPSSCSRAIVRSFATASSAATSSTSKMPSR